MKLKTLIPKSEARRMVLQRRQEITVDEISKKTSRIIEKLSFTDDFVYAKKVFCYISSRPGEVDMKRVINFIEGRGKSVIIPKLHKPTKTFHRAQFMGWDNIIKNQEGYFEPKFGIDEDMSDIDLLIVPSIAVSVLGQRVGSGGGYYDKLLKFSFAPKYVLAFEFQIFDHIETDVHDIRMDKVITELRIIDTRYPLLFGS